MKFFPAPYTELDRSSTPFCSGGRYAPHKVSNGPRWCEECGVDGLVTENSDHMYTTIKQHVLLCLKCAEMYKEFYELARLVNA